MKTTNSMICALLFATACVPAGKYDDAVHTADAARAQLATARAHLRDAEMGRGEMQKKLDDATAVDEQLSNELEKRGEDTQSLLATNGVPKQALQNSQRRLEELRRAQAAADARAALYRDLAVKLKGMIDAGDLAITLRDGRMVLRMSNDVLFDSGRAFRRRACPLPATGSSIPSSRTGRKRVGRTIDARR